MIRKPRDAARILELAARRAGQHARVAGFVGFGLLAPKHTKFREAPSARGNARRRRQLTLLENSLTDRCRVIARMTGPARKAWNGKGKMLGGAKNLNWQKIQSDYIANTRRA